MLTKENPLELLVDSHHGQYVPQIFAETIKRELFPSITAEDWAIIEAGPDHESYWDAWHDIEMSAETSDGISLWSSEGDLWAVNWSLIGNAEEIADIGETALELFNSCDARRSLLGELYGNLLDGPAAGRWSSELLSELRDIVQEIADRVSADLPRYWNSDFGIEESRVDVEQLLVESSPALKQVSAYW
jgi:hypothetical protein